MKKLTLTVLAGAAALALGACSSEAPEEEVVEEATDAAAEATDAAAEATDAAAEATDAATDAAAEEAPAE